MILFELFETEEHPEYQALQVANGIRQYDFLRSIVVASVNLRRPYLSHNIIKALNYHAIACLHTNAGEYRPCQVVVGKYEPPAYFRVPSLMDDFINEVNHGIATLDPVVMASFALWRLNYIHPFINGNGRTARAIAYYILCVQLGGWLPGTVILPELLKRERIEYVEALQFTDMSFRSGALDLSKLHALLVRLLNEQMAEAGIVTEAGASS